MNAFIKNVSVLSGGTLVAQLIPLAALPVLSRMYQPEHFGDFGVFMMLVTSISVLVTGRYEMGILIPKSNVKAKTLRYLSLALTWFWALLLLVITLLFSEKITGWLNIPDLAPWLWLLPVGILLQASYQTYLVVLNRAQLYKRMAAAKVSLNSGKSLLQIVFGSMGLGSLGLILGHLFGSLTGWVTLLTGSKDSSDTSYKVSVADYKSVASEFQKFPKFNAPHAFSNSLSGNLPIILFQVWFARDVAGFYALAMQLIFAPVTLVSTAVGKVFSQRISELHQQNKEYHSLTKKAVKYMFMVGLLPFALLMAAAPWAAEWFLSADYREVGVYLSLLAPAFYVVFATNPLNFIPLMTGHQKKSFVIDIIYTISRIAAIAVGIYLNDPRIAVFAFSMVTLAGQFYILQWIFSLSKKSM